MPNDCWNNITFAFKQKGEKVNQVYVKYFQPIKEYFEKEGECNPYFEKIDETARGMILRYYTGWTADEETIEKIIAEYPEIFIKNEYDVEDGTRGIIIYRQNVQYLHHYWFDLNIQQHGYYFGNCEEDDQKEDEEEEEEEEEDYQ
jgi:hypothetical protein